jgi:rubredoxin
MPIYLSGPRVLTYGELPLRHTPGVYLRCPDCKVNRVGFRDAAFNYAESAPCKCPTCGMALELVRQRTVYDVISPEEAEAK